MPRPSSRRNRSGAEARGPHGPEYNLIQRPDLSLALVKLFGLRQPHILPTLSENVTPVVILGDLSNSPHADPLRQAVAAAPIQNTLAGNKASIKIANLATSQVDLLFTIVSATMDNPGQIEVARSLDVTSIAGSVWDTVLMDGNIGLYKNGQSQVTSGTSVAGVGTNGYVRRWFTDGSFAETKFDRPLTIVPGTALVIQTSNVGPCNLSAYAGWIEVPRT